MRLACVIVMLFGLTAPVLAQSPMVSDLSSRRVAIESDFTGTALLLFGSLAEEGDVVVVVKGPPQTLTVRLKERVAGVWVNTESQIYDGLPGFYAVASNRALSDIASDRVLRRHGIGIDNIRITANDAEAGPGQAFPEAVRRLRRANDLYHEDPAGVSIRNGQLFRSNIDFPANVPVGQYIVQVYLFQDGQVVSAETSPILIDKSGIERAVYSFAHQWPLFYGIFAVLIAGFTGWGAAQIFRKS